MAIFPFITAHPSERDFFAVAEQLPDRLQVGRHLRLPSLDLAWFRGAKREAHLYLVFGWREA